MISGGESHAQLNGGAGAHEDLGGDPCLLRLPYLMPQTEWLTSSIFYFSQLWGLGSVAMCKKEGALGPPSWGQPSGS